MVSKRYFLLLGLFVVFVGSRASGDGCFVWRKGADLYEPTQKAIIYWEDGREVMVLQVKYEGPAEDFAWIVPVPAKPKVSAIDAEKSPFGEISLYTQYRKRWGLKGRVGINAEDTVTVLERKIVGVYDIAVLAASDATALNKWLNKNGYAFPPERKNVLEHYTKKKWVYVAMRIDHKALENDEVKKLKVGELQPICFSFAAREMVYPLKISSINAGEAEVLLYVLADAPMVVKSKHMRAGLSIEENIAYAFGYYTMRYSDMEYGTFRKVAGEELPLTWDALGMPKDKELLLCKYRAVYKVEEMTDDLMFERFEPIPYWQAQLREVEAEKYQRLKLAAISVLAYHDSDLLRRYAKDEDVRKRELVAGYPKALLQLHLELVGDKEDSVRLTLARNTRVGPDVLGKLAEDEGTQIRIEVASHPQVSRDTLEQLSDDVNKDVRRSVARNWKTPVRVLRKLATDKSYDVRRSVIYNSKMPKELLEELAHDESAKVRTAVAEYSRTTVKTLWKLRTDKSHSVRRGVALNLNTPVDILVELAKDENFWVRESVAYNPNAPLETLEELVKDNDANVSKAAKLALEKRALKSRN